MLQYRSCAKLSGILSGRSAASKKAKALSMEMTTDLSSIEHDN